MKKFVLLYNNKPPYVIGSKNLDLNWMSCLKNAFQNNAIKLV